MVFSYAGVLLRGCGVARGIRVGAAQSFSSVSLLFAATADHLIEVRSMARGAKQFHVTTGDLNDVEASNITSRSQFVPVKTNHCFRFGPLRTGSRDLDAVPHGSFR